MVLRSLEAVVGFRPAAVIFDMDGVLADTEPRNEQAMATVLARRDAQLTDDEYAGLVGRSNDATWAWIIGYFGLSDAAAALQEEYVHAVLPLLATIDPSPGAVELVDSLRAAGVRLAVASSSPRAAIDALLVAIGLASAFDAVVSGEEVAEGKPAPDIFRLAAERLDVATEECVVIEDSPHGLDGARRAGMRTIAVRTRYTAGQVLWADAVVDSLEELVVAP